MQTNFTRLSVFACCALAVFSSACDAELRVGEFDGSIFRDSGTDDDAGDVDAAADAGLDATTAEDAGDAATGPDVSDVPQVLANALCAALQACDGAQLLTDSLNGENCADITGSVFSARELSAFSDSVADGRITFDRTRLAACVSAITTQGCDVQTLRRPSVCEEAIRGKVALGGDCVISEDCSGTSSFCQAQAQCPGTCVALLNDGSACTNSDQCANNMVCAVVDDVRQCVTPGVPGAECGYADTPLCKRGNVCTPNEGDFDTCKAYSVVYVRQAGQSCDPTAGSFCEPNLACTNTPGGLVCAAIAARDGACFRAQPSQCVAGQYCDAATGVAGACQDLPEENEACLAMNRSQRCAPGYVCLGDSLCHIKGENGDDCDDNAQCYSGRCAGSECAPPTSLCSL